MARLPIIAILAAIGCSALVVLVGLGPREARALDYLQRVSTSCGQAASRVVRETGGQLLSAEPASDGRNCVVTVLVQGSGSERPRKVTVRVPL